MKYLNIVITSIFIAILFSVNTYASCGIWRDRDIMTVNDGGHINGDRVPQAAIGYSSDHTEDLSFTIELIGAEWDYDKSGTLRKGVTYKLDSKTLMTVYVDVGTGENEHDFQHHSLYIPLCSEPQRGGEIKFKVDGGETTVSSATITYAKCIDGIMEASAKVASIGNKGELRTITLNDDSTQIFYKNSTFTLELDNGFKFANTAEPVGTGKFEGKCSFSVDGSDPSKAYVKITEDTPEGRGKITLDGLVIERNSTGKFNAVLMRVSSTATMVKLDKSFTVAKYKSDAVYTETTTIAETSTETTTSAAPTTTETSTSAPTTAETTEQPSNSRNIVIVIGEPSYSVNGENIALDSPAYIEGGYTMLPLRAVANAFGITDENITYNGETKTAEFIYGKIILTVTAQEDKININGVDVPIDCPAQIKDGRMFLPLRAMANGFGITDENISYDGETKTVTISM